MTVVSKNFVFIHVPKSAGRSITKVLGGETRDVPTHLPHFCLKRYGLEDRFSFGFVRNPWDRAVSMYNFTCQKKLRPDESSDDQERARSLGFKRWLMEDARFLEQDEQWQSDTLLPMQRRPQMFWLDGCDFIGKVENIDADFAAIRAKIGLGRRSWLDGLLAPLRRLPNKNRSIRGSYDQYFDAESREFVATHFKRDIELFGYTFAGVTAR